MSLSFPRRHFLKLSALTSAALSFNILNRAKAAAEDPEILGQGKYRYRVIPNWGVLDGRTPVNDCHAMVLDRQGRLLLLTNEVRNNVIIYDRAGRLLSTWGHDFPGAHGLTLTHENGEEFLFLTDHVRHQVYKTTLDGRVVLTLNPPYESGHYLKGEEYKPTHVVVRDDGDFYVLDGYGKCHILHYDPKGQLKNVFGGRGKNPENVNEVHGGEIDRRTATPCLLVTSRQDSSLKRFSLDGKFLDEVVLTNGYPCFTVFHRNVIVIPQLWTADKKAKGFVTVLSHDHKVLSNIGGAPAVYGADGKLQPLQTTSPLFQHPHGILLDEEDHLYVAQWNSGRTYPLKLKPV